MQGWKGKMSKLVQWEWKGVPMVYPIAFIILLLPVLFWNFNNIHYFDEFEIAPKSARYLLSALVQSLAAIIAIVITLTLVAVQLAASAYSPRVIDVFKKNWVMWVLLVWYGLSVFFGLFVLEVIEGDHQNFIWQGASLEILVLFVYLMGVAAFIGLFFHISNMIDLLKPENIIKKLSNEIKSENVLEFIRYEEKQNKDRTETAKDDPVQPIVDVIHSAVMKYDIATTRDGLKAIIEKAIEVVRSGCSFSWDDVPGNDSNKLLEYLRDKFGIDWAELEDIHKSDEKTITILEGGNSVKITLDGDKENATEATSKIISDDIIHDLKVRKENGKLNIHSLDCERDTSKHFCEHLERIGKLAVSREDDESVIKVLENLESFGESTAKQKLGYAAEQATRSLGVVGIAAAEKRLGLAASQAAAPLGYVGKLSVENELDDAVEIAETAVDSLESIGKAAAEKELNDVVGQVAYSLKFVGVPIAEKELKFVGLPVAEKEPNYVVGAVTRSLKFVGLAAIKNELEDAVCGVAESLRVVGITVAGKGFKEETLEVLNSFGAVGKAAAEKELGDATFHIVACLGQLGITVAAKGNEFEDVTKQVMHFLNGFVWYSGRPKLETVALVVARSFIYIGVLATESGLNDAIQEAAKSLASISNKELVAQAINESESELQAYNDSLRKFMNLYEQHLKEL